MPYADGEKVSQKLSKIGVRKLKGHTWCYDQGVALRPPACAARPPRPRARAARPPRPRGPPHAPSSRASRPRRPCNERRRADSTRDSRVAGRWRAAEPWARHGGGDGARSLGGGRRGGDGPAGHAPRPHDRGSGQLRPRRHQCRSCRRHTATFHGHLLHAGRASEWEGRPGQLKEGDAIVRLPPSTPCSLCRLRLMRCVCRRACCSTSTWPPCGVGQRRAEGRHGPPSMTDVDGEPVGRLEGPLRWAVALGPNASVEIAGALSPPA